MPKPSFPAAAEGMPNFNRRSVLLGVGSVTAAAGVIAAPAQAAEDVTVRIGRLADELAEALSEFTGAQFSALVYPASHSRFPARLQLIDASPDVSEGMQMAICRHRQSRDVLFAAIDRADRAKPSKAARRDLERATKEEASALTMVCACNPRGPSDFKAKAEYLEYYVEAGLMTDKQIMAALYSGANYFWRQA